MWEGPACGGWVPSLGRCGVLHYIRKQAERAAGSSSVPPCSLPQFLHWVSTVACLGDGVWPESHAEINPFAPKFLLAMLFCHNCRNNQDSGQGIQLSGPFTRLQATLGHQMSLPAVICSKHIQSKGLNNDTFFIIWPPAKLYSHWLVYPLCFIFKNSIWMAKWDPETRHIFFLTHMTN